MIIQEFETLVKTYADAPFEQRMILAKKLYVRLLKLYEAKQYDIAIALAMLIKSLKCPIRNLDLIRAKLHTLGKIGGEGECLKEELRFFPDNEEAKRLLVQFKSSFKQNKLENITPDFEKLYKHIWDYTMVSPQRLQSLYTNAQKICANGVVGNFVECGVAAGGTSALLAYVIKQNTKLDSSRKLFCCDSFEGMPNPTEHDVSEYGVSANDTGWGAGTCAAPESSLLEICKKLNSDDVITIVKGYFEYTITAQKSAMGNIALLHMDGDWYSSTKVVIENFYDELVSGAYVQIDDYFSWQGCKKAIDEFFAFRELDIKLEKIDGEGVYFYKP